MSVEDGHERPDSRGVECACGQLENLRCRISRSFSHYVIAPLMNLLRGYANIDDEILAQVCRD